MGSWGTGIFQNDLALDIRDAFKRLLEDGMDISTTTRRILNAYRPAIEDEDDGPVIYLALAELQLEHNALESETKNAAIQVILNGQALSGWAEDADYSISEERKKVLEEFLQRLRNPQIISASTANSSVQDNKRHKCKVRPGDVIAISLSEQMIVAGLVIYLSKIFRNGVMLGFYDYLFSSVDHVIASRLDEKFIWPPNIYSNQPIQDCEWLMIDHRENLLDAVEIPELKSSNIVYYKDKIIRYIPMSDFDKYPSLFGPGSDLLRDLLREHFESQHPQMFQR